MSLCVRACVCAVYESSVLIQWVVTALLCVHVCVCMCACVCAVYDTVKCSDTVGHDSITYCVCVKKRTWMGEWDPPILMGGPISPMHSVY